MSTIKYYSAFSAAIIVLITTLGSAAAERPIRKCHFEENLLNLGYYALGTFDRRLRLRKCTGTGTLRPESNVSGRFPRIKFFFHQYWYFVAVSADQRQARTHQEAVLTTNTFAFHTFRWHRHNVIVKCWYTGFLCYFFLIFRQVNTVRLSLTRSLLHKAFLIYRQDDQLT